jgi:hypothetical protein
LTYDNLAVIGSNKREVQELRDAIMLRMRGTVDACDAKIAENSANVKVKEEFMCHGRSLRTNYKESDADKNNCCHLGVQYGIHKNELFVRVAPKTAKRWAHDFQQFNRSTATKRDVARICGIVLHAERIRHRALYEQPHLLAAMRSLYPIENWDAPAAVSDELFDMLNAAFLNPWTPLSKLSSEPIDCVIASDASGTGVGYIIYDAKQRCVDRTLAEPSVFPKHDDPHQAIFVKELFASRVALEAAKASGFRRPLLLTDNSAGAAALANGFSTNADANDIIRFVHGELRFEKLIVRAIPGVINPADELSRGKDANPKKFALLDILAQHPEAAPLLPRKLTTKSRAFIEDQQNLPDSVILDALAHLDVSRPKGDRGAPTEHSLDNALNGGAEGS